MNILRYLSHKDHFAINAFSVVNSFYKNKFFKANGIRIYRTAALSKDKSSLNNYLQYLKFNILTVLLLLKKRPSVLLCYETISIFPAYIYKKFFPSVELYIHFHEYTSLGEYRTTSSYIKWLFYLERKLYKTAEWISHTNLDRLNFFRTDHLHVKFRNLQVMPNYPPEIWYKETVVKDEISTPIKFVYVGALSLDSIYTYEFAGWIKELNGAATWDIYSGNHTADAIDFIKALNCSFISFKGEVDYFQLPKILRGYDIGVILYKGIIPNHIFSIPNKLFEYHSCGLDVWFSEKLKSSWSLITNATYPTISKIDFTRLRNINLNTFIDRSKMQKRFIKNTREEAFYPLLLDITKEHNG